MDLGHLLTRSGLTHTEVSSKFCHDSFCQLGNSVSLPWVIYYEEEGKEEEKEGKEEEKEGKKKEKNKEEEKKKK
jgi:hypothetical protein